MGKRKRSSSTERSILKKVRKMLKRHRRRRSSPSPSASSADSSSDRGIEDFGDILVEEVDSQNEENTTVLLPQAPSSESNAEVEPTATAETDQQTLDPEILKIFGEDPTNVQDFGPQLQKDIATRWQHLIRNGLAKDTKSELIKKYLPPENCPAMKPPKLNLEIKAALSETNYKKDLFLQSKQNQLTSSLSAIGLALNAAISASEKDQNLITNLSDAAKLLCDYQFRESQSRRYSIINTLNKQMKEIIKETKIDDFLFGSELADHLKSAKAINKSGSELKPSTESRSYVKVPPPASSTQARPGALNSRGVSRQAPPAATETRQNPAPRKQQARVTRDRRRDATNSRQYRSRKR